MEIELVTAEKEHQTAIQNLARFYSYDMSRYCGFLPGWEFPQNGLYESHDFSRYWNEPDRYPFLIKVNHEIAGFALINKIGSTSNIDWNMGEFFIVAKFQNKGIGHKVAHRIFEQFSGNWEVMQMPENQPAILFWRKVIDEYTKSQFETSQKIIAEPKPHPMIVLKFHTDSSIC